MSYDIDITKTPPAHEPERQYYYMAKAKGFVGKNLCSQLKNIKEGKARFYGDLLIDSVF